MHTAFTITLLLTSLLTSLVWADESEYTPNTPLKSTSSFSGGIFTNETEILTPRGIIDEPSTQMTLTQGLPVEIPSDAEISPAAGPEVSATVQVSSTGL